MVIIEKKTENGKRIAVLDDTTEVLAIDVLKNAITIAQKGKFDEYRFSCNGAMFAINSKTTYKDVWNDFNKQLDEMNYK